MITFVTGDEKVTVWVVAVPSIATMSESGGPFEIVPVVNVPVGLQKSVPLPVVCAKATSPL